MSTTLIAQQNDTVDAICWRHYGRTEIVVERVLQANPHIVELGPILPLGTRVLMPDVSDISTTVLQNLWD